MASRVRLGDLLVEAQIISREQLDEVLALQKQDGRRLGTLLCEVGLVTETQVTQILSQQLSVPWVSLHHIDFSRQLLNLVPQELAEKFCLVPIFVRRVRGQGETLYVAMDDPSDEAAQRDVSHYSGLPVRAMIAPPSDIRSAIRVYYGGSEGALEVAPLVEPQPTDPERVPQRPPPPPRVNVPGTKAAPVAEPPPLPSARTEREEVSPPAVGRRPVSTPSLAKMRMPSVAPVDAIPPPPDSSPQIEAREISMPKPKKKRGAARMVTLTLLDGTQVNLPARQPPKQPSDKPSRPPGDGQELTARDLVAALRAVSHGADATEILGGDVRWEGAFAALLSLLLKKQLIADWEFVEEYKKL
jgi:type IV pilus assembly protein PilB